MKKNVFPFVILITLLLSACSISTAKPAADPVPSTAAVQTGSADFTYVALNRDLYNRYLAKLEVVFNGTNSWKYQLQTRKSSPMREYALHIEGIDKSANPGDVRILTDGATSWMIGPGTEDECIQYPNDIGMDPTLLYPETLISEQSLVRVLTYVGEESVAGISSRHFSGSAPSIGDWKDVQVDVWQDKASQGLLRFTMQATGEDPFFGKGVGQLTAQYEASALDVVAIPPVEGCEIGVPLPEQLDRYVRLPGMASFESASSLEEMYQYYQNALAQAGWTEKEPLEQLGEVVVLSYQKNEESVEIQIETAASGGTKVKLIFLQDNNTH